MKKIISVLTGVVIACALSGCASGSLKAQQAKEHSALSDKQQADRQVERSKKVLVVSTVATADAAHNLEQAKQKQKDADANLQSILFPPLSESF
ncbi:Uncharacterised protein [Serratia proteamaculans]|uniref:hypothetical protein n=1 Tax=Serratia proteamaculans TaxID=28151 RepID=UPI00218357A6|nr:hypothetical protein [Serratia proteamaculans]CAI2428830.1 Uncharacterised protein [Serratia proteamaculans]